MSEGWKGDARPLMARISKIATGAGGLFVLAAGPRLALALPADPEAARTVAALYQPQRWKGRLFLRLAKWAIASGIAKMRPTYQPTTSPIPEAAWLKKASAAGCIGFLGCNPNHGPRCVLAGIDPSSGEKFIAKLGLDESAQAIRRESEVLESLEGRYPGVIRSMGLETSDANPQQDDRSSGFDWALLRLPHLGSESPKSMENPKVQQLLQHWLGRGSRPLGETPWGGRLLNCVAESEVPANWHEQMKSHKIRTALLHGDFAVWNLRNTPDGLIAIDWEWGVEDAVAGIDLAHGLRQECYMVQRMKPERAVAWMLSQADLLPWKSYLNACGWGGDTKDWLRLGLLHSHFNAKNDSAELLEVLGIHLNS